MQADLGDTFRTIDIDLAAFLLSRNIPMAGFHHDGQRLSFIFKTKNQCDVMVQQYECGDDSVSAHAISSASKRLRNLVRQNL